MVMGGYGLVDNYLTDTFRIRVMSVAASQFEPTKQIGAVPVVSRC